MGLQLLSVLVFQLLSVLKFLVPMRVLKRLAFPDSLVYDSM